MNSKEVDMMKRMRVWMMVALVAGVYSLDGRGQGMMPESVSIGYWGEMVTHPGVKIEANYHLKTWDKTRQRNNGSKTSIQKNLVLSPSIGSFYHRRYQTAILPSINIAYQSVRNEKRTFRGGLGVGYLRTFVPNTYSVSDAGIMESTMAGHNYLAGTVFASWGRNFSQEGLIPSSVFLKPQFVYAVPNFPGGVAYFMLEVGFNYRLK